MAQVKIKDGQILPNNWKECGYTAQDWEDLNSGKSIEMGQVPVLIKEYVDVVESASKFKQKKVKGDK